MLKVVSVPKSDKLYLRGTVRRQSVFETTGTTDKKIAEEIRVKREAELMTASVWGKAKVVTFAHAALDYLDHGGNERFMKPLADYFGTTLLREIDQDAIDKAAKKLLPKASPATRNRQVYTPVSAVLHHAARKKWCDAPLIARPKVPPGVVRFLKPDERERLIAACAPHLKPLVIFMLYTGARTCEAIWLTWDHVDLDREQARFVKTKNGDARSVPLHSRVMEALTALKHREGEVFLTPAGTPYARPQRIDDTSAGTRIKTAFNAACRRAGIKDFTPHCCRHDWATAFYQATHDLAALQYLGGWKTVSMVLRYAHTDVSNHAASIEMLTRGISVDLKSEVA